MAVKMDMSRDYYADLELGQSAEITDIKRSFKRLALKYHPDRNPGKEDEAKDRFILIQAAHEVLTNPEAKASYDAKRRSAGRYGGASGVTGNPWMNTARDVNSQYGAPPQRRPPMPPRPVPTTSTGASSRYQGWGQGKQAPKPKTDSYRSQSEAWERARASSAQKPAPTAQRPTKTARDVPPSPTPRTAAQARRQDAAFGSTRRTGFQPSSPMPGDEPPVRNHNYNTGYTGNTAGGDGTTSTPYTTTYAGSTPASKPRPQSEFIDPLTQQFRDANIDNRQRTPYASYTGERTNPFEPLNVNRAKSMRDAGRQVPGAQPASPPRQRSASVGSDGFRRSTAEPYHAETSQRPPPPQSKASARYSPRAAQHQQQPDSVPATNAGFATGTAFGAAAAAAGAAAFAAANTSTSSINSSTHANAGASSQAKSGPRVFAVPDDNPTSPVQQTRFARHSADNINTQFVSEENGKFEFSAGADSPSRDDPFMRARQRHRGRQSPLRNEFTASQDRFTTAQPQQAPPPVPPKVSAFDAKNWEESIKASNIFEPKLPTRSSVSPTRPMRPMKKSRPVRMTAGNAGLVDDEETTSGEDKPKAAGPSINGSRSPNAMDVDPPVPDTPIQPEPRNIPVEPTKPEWRAGNVGPNATGGAPLNPKPASGFKMPAVSSNTVGSEDTEDFMKPNIFADFQNCAPFNEKPSGLGSFADLSTNLPFPSAPSMKISIPKAKPEPLACPPAPPVPKAPVALMIPTGKIGSAAWNQYVKEFENYLKAFSAWNRQMVNHFSARQKAYEDTGFSWVNTMGDVGYTDYINAMEQDKPIRQKWITACNAHEIAFREFQQLRWGLLRER